MTPELTSTRLLRLDEVADRLAVSLPTIRRLVKEGQLRTVRVGRQLRVRPGDLDQFILQNEARSTDQVNRAKGDQA
mgnify:FL=1